MDCPCARSACNCDWLYRIARALGSGGGGHVAASSKNPWLADLVGERVSLPARDSQGFKIGIGGNSFLVAMSCSSCSYTPDGLFAAGIRPVILVVPEPLRLVPKELLGKPDRILVVSDPGAKHVPLRMLNNAPQAAKISQQGEILTVPKQDQSLSSFLRSEDK